MKRNLKYLFLVMASSLVLTGCCTARHAIRWEYKVADLPDGKYKTHTFREMEEAFLNDLAKDGWIFLEKDASGNFILKRPKN